jgi:hypothetical protein
MAKKSLIAALALGIALISGPKVYSEGQIEETEKVEQSIPESNCSSNEIALENSEPKIMATFEYESNRKGYEGDIFRYNLLEDSTISQADKPTVKLAQRWFYDVDGDGEFGDAEVKAIESGKIIYMHPEFNKIASKEIKKIFEELGGLKEQYETEVGNLEKELEKEKEDKIGESNKGLDLILGFNADSDFNSFGGSIGLKYNFSKNIALSALANFNKAGDENLSNTRTPEFKGIYGEINKDETNSFSIGPSLEFQAGPFIFGGGFNYWNWIEEIKEEIKEEGTIVKSNTNSIPNSKNFGNIYAGLELKFKNWGIGGIGGYDFKQGPYFGARATIKLNKPQNRPRGN